MRRMGWFLMALAFWLGLWGNSAQGKEFFSLRPVYVMTPVLFELDQGEKLIALVNQKGEEFSHISLDLLRMDQRGLTSKVGRYRFEIPGLRKKELKVVNQPAELPYVILSGADGLILIYELPLLRDGGGLKRDGYSGAEPGIAALRLLSNGRVEKGAELKFAHLLEESGVKVANHFIQLAGLRSAEDGQVVELLLVLRKSYFEGGELYLVRLDAESLKPRGEAKHLGWLCSTCTASFSGKQVVIVQQFSPLAKLIDPKEGKEERVVFDNLLAGNNLGLVYQLVPSTPLWPPSPFGKGWAGEVYFGTEIWTRLGGKWYLTSQDQREKVVATFNSQGQFERLTRLPPSWRMGRSFDPDWLIFYNRFSSEIALVSRNGVVKSLAVDEHGQLSRGVIPKWLENRLRLLSYRPLDLTRYSSRWGTSKKGALGTGPLFLMAGPDAVGVAKKFNFGRELRVKVMDYNGKPLYEVSLGEEKLIDPEALRPKQADAKHYQAQVWPGQYMPTQDGLYGLIPLSWVKRGPKSYETEELNPSPDSFYRVALVHISPAGTSRLVTLLNLEDAFQKGGIVLKERVAEVVDDLLLVKAGSAHPQFALFTAPTRKGVKSFVELRIGNEIAGWKIFYRRKLGMSLAGDAPRMGNFAPPGTVCEIELAKGELGRCEPELPSGFDDQPGPGSFTRLFPKQVEWITDLELEAPVFFQGWSLDLEEGGEAVPLYLYDRRAGILAYSKEGFLGYLYVPSELDYIEGKLRDNPESPSDKKLLCRWSRDGAIRACAGLPGQIELKALDPKGRDSFWIRFYSEDRGAEVLLIDRSRSKGKLYYWDGEHIAEEHSLPPLLDYLIETIAGPVEWKPLPKAVFKLHPGKVPNYRELVSEESEQG